MVSPEQIICVALPKSHPDPVVWQALVDKWRDLRLHSLTVAPEAFGSSLERELAFDNTTWHSRVNSPIVTSIVAVSRTTTAEDSVPDPAALVEQAWLGTIVLIDKSVEKPPGPDDDAAFLFINGLFVYESQRGKGVGKALVSEVLDLVRRGSAQSGVRPKVSVSVFVENQDAAGLYRASGFVQVKEETVELRGQSRIVQTLELAL